MFDNKTQHSDTDQEVIRRSMFETEEETEEKEETVSEGQQRADAAKSLQQDWKKRGVKYSNTDRTFKEDASFADCASFVVVALSKAKQGSIFTSQNAYTGKGGAQPGQSMQRIIYESAYGVQPKDTVLTEDDYKKPYRFDNPVIGDIMMWKGHVAIVAELDEDKKTFRFAHMISGGADLSGEKWNDSISYKDQDKMLERIKAYSGRNDFYGFWTPPVQIKK
ncbi:MAG: hypothetical protein JWO09_2775 [Bacteroidetes bacterium]|nr:hypothetical protein [Bacteroidota bacterium]